MIYGFHKTPEALPDEEIRRRGEAGGQVGLWTDWSKAVREAPAAATAVAAVGDHLQRHQLVSLPPDSPLDAKL